MLRLKEVRPAEMPEVLRIATELYAKERAQIQQAQEREGWVAAAAEMDLPPEYLERAAALWHERRAAAIRQRRRMQRAVLGTLGVLLGLAGGWSVMHRAPPAPVAYPFAAAAADQWRLDTNPESQATVAFEKLAGSGGAAAITVQRFAAPEHGGRYFVNLNTTAVPSTLAGYQTVAFRVRGTGLPAIRLYLEGDATERWRSPALPVSPDWQEHRLRLEQFDHQTRASGAGTWRRDSYRSPGRIERLSFKLGDYINPITARGQVAISGLRFE